MDVRGHVIQKTDMREHKQKSHVRSHVRQNILKTFQES